MTDEQKQELTRLVQAAKPGVLVPMPQSLQNAIDNDLASRCHDEIRAMRVKNQRSLADCAQTVLA